MAGQATARHSLVFPQKTADQGAIPERTTLLEGVKGLESNGLGCLLFENLKKKLELAIEFGPLGVKGLKWSESCD